MTDLSSADRVALLALWSRLELLRAAGVDTSSLRERVREQLLAAGFDPLAPRPAEVEASAGVAATIAKLEGLQASLQSEQATLDELTASYEQNLEQLGELPEIQNPAPETPVELPDSVTESLASKEAAAKLAGLTEALGIHAAAAGAELENATKDLAHLDDAVEEMRAQARDRVGDLDEPSTDDDAAKDETPLDRLKKMKDRIENDTIGATDKLNELSASLPDPGSIPAPDMPSVPGFDPVPE